MGKYYTTKCVVCGNENAYVKYFIWVKLNQCKTCGKDYGVFPGYLLAKNKRHPKNVIICSKCGKLNEVNLLDNLGNCQSCGNQLILEGNLNKNISICPHCGNKNQFHSEDEKTLKNKIIAIEYYCKKCEVNHKGRYYKNPDEKDYKKYEDCEYILQSLTPKFIPDTEILPGDETNRLLKLNYKYYKELFNSRQLLALEKLANLISKEKNKKIRYALSTNFSDLLRYQNMLCRYDTYALKSLDIFSIHGFPTGLISCESNIFGLKEKNILVGSGGWLNITNKYVLAKKYCDKPFEIIIEKNKKRKIFMTDEWIGETKNYINRIDKKFIELHCESANKAILEKNSIDAILTDPPYFSNVQYAELMDFCYVWLRKLLKNGDLAFKNEYTRSKDEFTGNITQEKGIEHFANGLSEVFQRFTFALKEGKPLIFTYHHNSFEAYYPIAIAVLDSKLLCTTVFPCPSEMIASIHINGTSSSKIDSVFVCRSKFIKDVSKINIFEKVMNDCKKLKLSDIKLGVGDVKCIMYGHIISETINDLNDLWDKRKNINEKLNIINMNIIEKMNKMNQNELVKKVLMEVK